MEQNEGLSKSRIQFNYEFLTDPRYVNSKVKKEIDLLNLPVEITKQTGEIIKDLDITYPLFVGLYVPDGHEKLSIIPSLGIGGKAIKDKKIRLFFDPDHDQVVENIKKYQFRQIAHEINHTTRFHAFPTEKKTLLNSLIFEGLATFYEENLGGVYQATPWGNALTYEQIKDEWQKATEQSTSPDYNHKRWFFGAEKEHPVWAGYSLGNEIIKQYKQLHPTIEIREMVKIPTEEIVHKVKFA